MDNFVIPNNSGFWSLYLLNWLKHCIYNEIFLKFGYKKRANGITKNTPLAPLISNKSTISNCYKSLFVIELPFIYM